MAERCIISSDSDSPDSGWKRQTSIFLKISDNTLNSTSYLRSCYNRHSDTQAAAASSHSHQWYLIINIMVVGIQQSYYAVTSLHVIPHHSDGIINNYFALKLSHKSRFISGSLFQRPAIQPYNTNMQEVNGSRDKVSDHMHTNTQPTSLPFIQLSKCEKPWHKSTDSKHTLVLGLETQDEMKTRYRNTEETANENRLEALCCFGMLVLGLHYNLAYYCLPPYTVWLCDGFTLTVLSLSFKNQSCISLTETKTNIWLIILSFIFIC